PLSSTVFLRFKIRNRGANTVDSLMIGLWSDPDLGGAGDDHTASDSALALTYLYNGHYRDLVYGDTPPALGYVLLRGVTSAGAYALIGPFKGAEEPRDILQTRNTILGNHSMGLPMLDPTGRPTRFWFSGHPETGTGWLDPV